jgi:hypothetical protein
LIFSCFNRANESCLGSGVHRSLFEISVPRSQLIAKPRGRSGVGMEDGGIETLELDFCEKTGIFCCGLGLHGGGGAYRLLRLSKSTVGAWPCHAIVNYASFICKCRSQPSRKKNADRSRFYICLGLLGRKLAEQRKRTRDCFGNELLKHKEVFSFESHGS